jgi:hypothetical protein
MITVMKSLLIYSSSYKYIDFYHDVNDELYIID